MLRPAKEVPEPAAGQGKRSGYDTKRLLMVPVAQFCVDCQCGFQWPCGPNQSPCPNHFMIVGGGISSHGYSNNHLHAFEISSE